jgi:ribosomal protein S18 acetylase RimI-like enzyme
MGPNGSERQAPEDGATRGPGSPGPTVTVRPAAEADAALAARLHAGQISEGFLALLGPRFLQRLYRRVGRSPGSFLLVAECGGVPGGFLAGSTDVAGLYKSFLWHDGIPAAVGAVGPLLTGWRRVLETLRHGSSGGEGVGRGGELLAVAVDPASQGRGAGRLLVAAFLDEIAARGGDAAHVVVGAANSTAVALYERSGFVTVDRFELHPGTESLLMQWDRPTSATGGQDRA